MAVAWALTDSGAKNIYTKMCNWYNSPDNLPNNLNDTAGFKGYPNFTRDKLYYCIEYLKKNFGRGWFNDQFDERAEVLNDLAQELAQIFGGTVDAAGIKTFLNWVYNFAKHDTDALNYFQGGYYSIIQSMTDAAKTNILDPVNKAVETVKYGVSYPVLTLENPVIKWGLVVGVGFLIYKMFSKR